MNLEYYGGDGSNENEKKTHIRQCSDGSWCAWCLQCQFIFHNKMNVPHFFGRKIFIVNKQKKSLECKQLLLYNTHNYTQKNAIIIQS